MVSYLLQYKGNCAFFVSEFTTSSLKVVTASDATSKLVCFMCVNRDQKPADLRIFVANDLCLMQARRIVPQMTAALEPNLECSIYMST